MSHNTHNFKNTWQPMEDPEEYDCTSSSSLNL